MRRRSPIPFGGLLSANIRIFSFRALLVLPQFCVQPCFGDSRRLAFILKIGRALVWTNFHSFVRRVTDGLRFSLNLNMSGKKPPALRGNIMTEFRKTLTAGLIAAIRGMGVIVIGAGAVITGAVALERLLP